MPKGLSAYIMIFGLLLVFIVGCSGGTTPVLPPTGGEETQIVESRPAELEEGNRVSWGYYLFHVNEDHTVIDVEPQRGVNFHINVQPFLEDEMFCPDCLRIDNITASGHGTLLIDITLVHPFPGDTVLTGFDVRGTAIFDAEKMFPNTFMQDSSTDRIFVSARLLNADGWTTHFNAEDKGYYEKGKMVAPWLPDPIGNLHPFKAFWTISNRRVFEAGGQDTCTFDIDLPPGDFVFGYSVDTSFEFPYYVPPLVPDDFPMSANSIEAFEMRSSIITNTLTRTGGSAQVEIEVYDWQGPATIDRVFVEAPDLFAGTLDMTATGLTTPTSATYTVTLNNINMNAPTTTGVDMLVCAEDIEITTVALDLRAFTIINLPVADVTPNWRPRGNTFFNIPIGPILPDGVIDFGVANPDLNPGPGEDIQCRVYLKKDSTEEFWRYDDDFTSAMIFAGYPGSTPSWILPTSRMDVTNRGIMAVHSSSWSQLLQPTYDNYTMSLSNFFFLDGSYNHSWFSRPDIPADPNDYQERAYDLSNGWGNKLNDPMYVLYAYESSASGGGIPSDVSIMSIRDPYNTSVSPYPATRTLVPRGVGLGMVDENTLTAFAIDDQPAGLPPNANLAFILDSDGIEVFEVYFVSLPTLYHGTMPMSLIPVPGVFPVDMECLPSNLNGVWTGSGTAATNWLVVLLDVTLMNQFVVAILEWDIYTNSPVLLHSTNPYPGKPLAMDVDVDDFEVYVLSDNGGVIEATIFEYF